jgi:hypothetical protein
LDGSQFIDLGPALGRKSGERVSIAWTPDPTAESRDLNSVRGYAFKIVNSSTLENSIDKNIPI